MPVSIECPGCGTNYDIPSKAIGRKVSCKCGKTFIAKVPSDDPHVDFKPLEDTGPHPKIDRMAKTTPRVGLDTEVGFSAMPNNWQVQVNGKVYGPFSDDKLRSLAAAGKINKKTPIRTDANAIWTVAERVPGLFVETAFDFSELETSFDQKPMQPAEEVASTSVSKRLEEKFCHECGAVIRRKAEICPKCGCRQPLSSHHESTQATLTKSGRPTRSGITIPILISAIWNVLSALIWLSTIVCFPIAIVLIVLCIFEFMFYSDADGRETPDFLKRSKELGIAEIACGFFNLASLICGIIVLINRGKYERAMTAADD